MIVHNKNMLYSPIHFRISPNLPESNARALARYFSLGPPFLWPFFNFWLIPLSYIKDEPELVFFVTVVISEYVFYFVIKLICYSLNFFFCLKMLAFYFIFKYIYLHPALICLLIKFLKSRQSQHFSLHVVTCSDLYTCS